MKKDTWQSCSTRPLVSLECWEVSFEGWLETDILCVMWSLKPLAQQSYFDNWIWSSRYFEENVFL